MTGCNNIEINLALHYTVEYGLEESKDQSPGLQCQTLHTLFYKPWIM